LNKTITINKKEINVNFSGYYDSAIGDLLFTQVMCDVFMPGNDVVPIQVEKEQIKRITEGFKKRKALYDELRKETVKGKSYYVITPRLRYDLGWLEGKKKVILTKERPPQVEETAAADTVEPAQTQSVMALPDFTDSRRKYLISVGFQYNPSTKNWEAGSIRFPDAMIDKSATDEAFIDGMNRLIAADENSRKKKPKNT
jgi:hypothetical protein